MSKTRFTLLLSLAGSLLAAAPAAADIRMPAIFGDHMVLQKGRKIPFWGTADSDEPVSVTAGAVSGETKADSSGHWKIQLGPLAEKGAFTVTVKGGNTLTFSDVVLGEVWVASGQSNMEWTLVKATNGEREVYEADHGDLRLFRVENPKVLRAGPADVRGRWEVSSPASAAQFSAVGYFFGRELMRKLQLPVGVIQSAWGGMPAEAFTSRTALKANPQLRHLLKEITLPADAVVSRQEELNEADELWQKAGRQVDTGNQGEALGFASVQPQLGWPTMVLPRSWENADLAIDGAVWFRRRVFFPREWAGEPLTLRLGAVNDCDTTYVNGAMVGATCRETPRHASYPRRYTIPAELTRTGQLLVAVRVFDEGDQGGMNGDADSMKIIRGEKPDGPSVSIAGEWAYHVEKALAPIARDDERPKAPEGVPRPSQGAVLHDNMVSGLIPYAIAGAIWYQGESNVERAYQYRTLFPLMIQDWRAGWGQGDFPFLFVQLAGFHPRWPAPGRRSDEEWAELREAQAVALRLPATGMAVATDIGDRNDIHPRNKQEVGRRLALIALGKTYGQSLEWSGPTLVGHASEKDGVRLRFEHAEGLAGGTSAIEIAGRDRRFVAAAVKVDGETLLVSAPGLKPPLVVRYSWTDAPIGNLTNAAGLPAAPFRTDKWPYVTANRK